MSGVENPELKTINLEEIAQIQESEFTKYFREWLQEDDVARNLQAKLRKDLYDIFNRTALGRKISSELENIHRIMLSPLILVLNTLVAEFLYEQNYHYSLSVFCTEIPYRHTLPNFEKAKKFRFNETELYEIFEAISPTFHLHNELLKNIINQYKNNNNDNDDIKNKKSSECSSLLFYIFKNIFKQTNNNDIENDEIYQQKKLKSINHENNNDNNKNNFNLDTSSKKSKYSSLFPSTTATSSYLSTSSSSSSTTTTINIKQPKNYQSFKNINFLNKYLAILSKKLHVLSRNINDLQKHHDNNNKTTIHQINHKQQTLLSKLFHRNKKFEILNRNLENISKNLKYFSITKCKNYKISQILNALQKITQQFEKCTLNIENISKLLQQQQITTKTTSTTNKSNVILEKDLKKHEKTYYEWIDEMKTSKNGKKFLLKIESCLLKTLEKEKEKLTEEYKMEMELQKELIETKYREKLLQDLSKQSLRIENVEKAKMENIEKTIEMKFKELGFTSSYVVDTFNKKEQENLKQDQEIQTDFIINKGNLTNVTKILDTKETATTEEKIIISTKDYERNDENDENDDKVNDLISLQKEILKKLSNQPQILPSVSQNITLETPPPNIQRLTTGTKSADITTIKSLDKDIILNPQMHEITKTIVQKERNVDQIIFEAKLRIKELEYENNELNKGFEEYLERNKNDKNKIDKNIVCIWDNYNIDKELLQKKCKAIQITKNYENYRKEKNNKIYQQNDLKISTFSDIDMPNCKNQTIFQQKSENQNKNIQIIKFENPFRQLQKNFKTYKKNYEIVDEVENSNKKEIAIDNDMSKSTSKILKGFTLLSSSSSLSPQKRFETIHSKLFALERANFKTVEHNEMNKDANDDEITSKHCEVNNMIKSSLTKQNDEILQSQLKVNDITFTKCSSSDVIVSPSKSSSIKSLLKSNIGVKRKLFDSTNNNNENDKNLSHFIKEKTNDNNGKNQTDFDDEKFENLSI